MARIGLKSAKYSVVDPKTNKYGEVKNLDNIIDEKFAAEYNSAELYADDALCESDYSFKKGTLTITVAHDNDARDAELMGNNATTDTSGVVTKTINDAAPEVGYGHIVTKVVGGARAYKVEFFPRVKFTKITTDAKTRGESVEFGTTTMEAVVYPLAKQVGAYLAGQWQVHKTLNNEDDAVAFLEECMENMPDA